MRVIALWFSAFSLCIRDLGRYDIRLFLACTHVERCISAESLYLRQGHDWRNEIPAMSRGGHIRGSGSYEQARDFAKSSLSTKLGSSAEQSGLEKERLWSMIRPFAPVAQLDRVPDYESGGRTFESYRARHIQKSLIYWMGLFCIRWP